MLASRFDGPPVPGAGSKVRHVIRLRGGQRAHLVVLSRKIQAYLVHWVDGRTRLCLGKDSCLFCERKSPLKWRGYLAVQPYGPGVAQQILELTPDLARQIEGAHPSKPDFRGLILTIRRGGSHNSRIWLEASQDYTGTAEVLPEPVDIKPTMEHLFAS